MQMRNGWARPQPVSADDDLLNMDLGEIQYQAVAPAKPKSQPVAGQNKSGKKNSGKKRLTKRQREDKALAEKLGEDWNDGPKSEYRQVNDESRGWMFDLWDVIATGPVQAFYRFILGSVMLVLGLQMLIWFGIGDDGISAPGGRFLMRLPMFFAIFGAFASVGGLVMFIRGLCNKEKRDELTTSSMGLMIGTAAVMLVVTIGIIIWLVANA